MFHVGYDQIIRRCVAEEEQGSILSMCHSSTCGGHFSAQKTTDKILQSGFYWPTDAGPRDELGLTLRLLMGELGKGWPTVSK